MGSLWRRKSSSLESFAPPANLSDVALVQTLTAISSNLISSYCSGNNNSSLKFQRKNSRSLIRKIRGFLVVLEYLRDCYNSSSNSSPSVILPRTAILCCKELYHFLYRSRILLDYCNQSNKLWLLLQNQSVSGHFHELNKEFFTLLDVFPFEEVEFSEDLREQIELMKKQSKGLRFYIDDEDLRATFFSFLHEFENGRIPDKADLELFFLEKMGIRNAKSCRAELEFLEEQLHNHEGDVQPTTCVLNGFVAVVRYCRFLLFGFEEDEVELCNMGNSGKAKKGLLITQENAETFLTIPKDFCCPISLDLMQDPVIVSTGQTYDRSSISRWIEEGHCSCPKSGQMLVHTRLVPNRALRNLIMMWCTAHGFQSDPPESTDSEALSTVSPTKAAIEANNATTLLLVQQLTSRSEVANAIAARELRYLAKTGKENRAYIAQAGAIPHLHKLLASSNAIAQENSVTAMLNLSIYDKNKCRIIDEQGCLRSIVDVLRNGLTTEAKENAAATLFSLSVVHDYKKIIAEEEGAVVALAKLLKNGTRRGRKDAVTALFNLSTHIDNFAVIIESGGVKALVEALGTEGVSEEAAGALALIVRKPNGAEAVGDEEAAVPGLIAMMRCGSPKGKENAVAALLELCRSGVATATQRVVKAPALEGLLQSLLFTGTKRARRKAASLARECQRSENAYAGLGVGYVFARNSAPTRDSSFANDHLSVSMSVPVL